MPPFADEIARAQAAQIAWACLPLRERLRPVREFRHLLVERTKELTDAITTDIGRPATEVIATDFLPTASACKFLQQSAEHLLRPRRVTSRPLWLLGCRDQVHHRPHGIVGIIGTWNYPLFLNAVPILQALTAGNAVLWKPSELTPRTAKILTSFFHDAGFPKELLNTLPTTREAGPQLAEADIDLLHFTGSEDVGRKLAARLGERLIPSVLELSGCDALFVMPDANVRLAARAAWYGATLNAGQTCMATRRVFVHRSVYAQFVEELRPLIAATQPVSLVLSTQVERMNAMIAEATMAGAKILRSEAPHQSPGRVAATAIIDATPELTVCQELSFAPIVAVIEFDDLDAAVAQYDRCRFGLAASIFSIDRAAAAELASRLRVGCVVINDVIAPTAHPETPFGGRGASGWGVSQGAEGLLQMTVPQVVTYRRGSYRPHVDAALSNDPATDDVMGGMLRFTHGRTLGNRWRGFWQMFRGMRRFGK